MVVVPAAAEVVGDLLDDPQILLEAAVTSALNSFHDLMGDNPLAADPQKFVATITQAAREWAEECFNSNH